MVRGKMLAAAMIALAVVGVAGEAVKADSVSFAVSETDGGSPFAFTTIGVAGSGGSGTLKNISPDASGVPVSVTVTDASVSFTVPAYLNLTATATGAATSTVISGITFDTQALSSGSLSITTLPGGGGVNIVTASFLNALLGFDTATGVSILSSSAGGLVLSSAIASLVNPETVNLGLSNLNPSLSINGTSLFLNGFTGSAIGGTISANGTVGSTVPLPAAAWTGLSSLAGLGVLAAFRKRARLA